MKLLLDTHIFLWFISGDSRLRPDVRDAIEDTANEVYLSPGSIWEAIVKHKLGKLPLPKAPEIYLLQQRERHVIESLPLDEVSVARLAELPAIHRDPFDRMLICQAIQHNLVIVTVDPTFNSYSVPLF